MRPDAIEAMLPWLSGGNPTGVHAMAREAKAALEAAREEIGALCGARPTDVIVTGGGTEADNLALFGAARAARDLGHGAHIVVSAIEHKAVLSAAHALEREGFTLSVIPAQPSGAVDVDAVLRACEADTVVVSVMLVNNETGIRQPVTDIARGVRERSPHAVVHTDAIQAVPWLDLAAETANVDCVTVSAHKVGGPKGVGVLIARHGVPLAPVVVGGGQERGIRAGTHNVAGAVGFATALRATAREREVTNARVAVLRDRLRAGLLAIDGAFVNGDPDLVVPGILSIGFAKTSGELLVIAADRAGIACSAGSSCASGATEPSGVLTAMGISGERARASIRLSLGYATNDDDVDAALAALPVCVDRIRGAAVSA